jgi:hypothetical protein
MNTVKTTVDEKGVLTMLDATASLDGVSIDPHTIKWAFDTERAVWVPYLNGESLESRDFEWRTAQEVSA